MHMGFTGRGRNRSKQSVFFLPRAWLTNDRAGSQDLPRGFLEKSVFVGNINGMSPCIQDKKG